MTARKKLFSSYITRKKNKKINKQREKNQEKLELELRKERYEDAVFGLVLFIFLTLAVLLIYCATSTSSQETVHVKVYGNGVLLLEYTGKSNSWKKSGEGYSFTVDEKNYIFKDVDTIEITNLEDKEE